MFFSQQTTDKSPALQGHPFQNQHSLLVKCQFDNSRCKTLCLSYTEYMASEFKIATKQKSTFFNK